MSIKGYIQARNTYIYAEVSGIFEIKQAKRLTLKMLDAVSEYKIPKILFDARQLRGEISTIQRFEYATFLSSTLLKGSESREEMQPRLAVVADQSILDRERFVELVARNRGTIIRVTVDIDEAYEWLGEKASEPATGPITPITDNEDN